MIATYLICRAMARATQGTVTKGLRYGRIFALSTTQVATGAIFGAGAGRRLASVDWGVAGQMAIA